jgi:undecaprenyl-diphosphatase
VAWLAAIAVGVLVAGARTADPIDAWLIGVIHHAAGTRGVVARALVAPTTPAFVYGVAGLLTVLMLARRRWAVTVLVIITPAIAVLFTELVFKPLVDRHIGGQLSYPSGHTVSTFSVGLLGVLVASRTRRVLCRVALAAVTVCFGAGLVAMNYHYPSDVLGGLCVATGFVVPSALVADAVSRRSRRRATRRPIERSPAGISSGTRPPASR